MRNLDYVLMAAAQLCEGDKPTAVSRLVVRAWMANKAAYGLPGYEHAHPDSHRVQVAIQHLLGRAYGDRYLTKTPALLERCGRGLVRVTEQGWARIAELRKTVAGKEMLG